MILNTPGLPLPALEARERIASILAAIETAHIMEAKFKAMVDQEVLARQFSGELDTDDKKQKLLAGHAEELSSKLRIGAFLVAGA